MVEMLPRQREAARAPPGNSAGSTEQVVQRAKTYGFDGIELDGKRPHGFPLDWPKSRCTQFRKLVNDSGLAISGVAADNDFSSPVSEMRESQLANIRELARMTADLGAKVVRVFMAWPGATKIAGGGARYDLSQKVWQYMHDMYSEEEVWSWCRECLREAARYAGDYGVTLALQNHRPVLKTYHDMLKMIHEVNSPHLKACLDAAIMEKKDPAYLRQAVYDTGALQVQSHFGGDFEQSAPEAPIRIRSVKGQWAGPYLYEGYQTEDIYTPFIQALLETGYRGYIGYELCHPLPVVNGKTVGIDYVDKSARLAPQYLRGIIAEARKRALAAQPS
jgi:sugar phosphate isomerase/epimerase